MNLYDYHAQPQALTGFNQIDKIVPLRALSCAMWDDDHVKDYEKAISKTPYTAYQYALKVEDGPFPMGEPAIASDANYAYKYAKNILHNRFKLGEPAIAKDENVAYQYIVHVLKSRFELAEPVLKDAIYWGDYYTEYVK